MQTTSPGAATTSLPGLPEQHGPLHLLDRASWPPSYLALFSSRSLVAKAGTGTAGVGRKLGGSEPAAAAAGAGGSSSAAAAAGGEDTPEARRARMAAAAEARFKAQAPQ